MNDKIALLMPNGNVSNREVLLHLQGWWFSAYIFQNFIGAMTHCSIHCFFPYYVDGWHVNLKLKNGNHLLRANGNNSHCKIKAEHLQFI